ncbi:hypothetical protein FOQG_18714 [Fusarium oxysporum f. sp. raphani 54005]|jgi:hypothetical protein|uniref:Uncharacterized protein n=3 Tax=Fusarium oxysporum TaxID=5507 RepID=X0BCI8_FUSOX|nr:hypothetical protein FOVG_17245 [Fusarium oxysporum f. sp. pisi HDV247]EXK76543.1 hypothetical protein FOQG_18714 [Fusarium oxysporum f. sp. raphani 54005]EXM13802.1 hypothetical protein FOTG_17760 [Fusarium oxysporum f. sp. vasinfectum 25433]
MTAIYNWQLTITINSLAKGYWPRLSQLPLALASAVTSDN